MTTKELIQQYVTAHADNRWMDASELEALLTEFAEKLKEPASEDLEKAANEFGIKQGVELKPFAIKFFTAGAQWDREQIMKDAIHCKVFWHDGPLLDYTQEQQDDVLEKIGAEVGDKVKVIIVKDND